MGSKERKTRQRGQQRQDILDAASQIIANEGYSGLSMRKLADRIEYSPASIYLHFASRERIAQELRESGFQALTTCMRAAVAGKRGRDALHAIATAYVAFGIGEPELYRLIFMGSPGFMRAAYEGEQSGDAADQAYEQLLTITGGLDGAPKERQNLTQIADVIWSCLHGIVSLNLALSDLQATAVEIQTNLSIELITTGLLPLKKERVIKRASVKRSA